MLHSSEESLAHSSEYSIPNGVRAMGLLKEMEAPLQCFILKAVAVSTLDAYSQEFWSFQSWF